MKKMKPMIMILMVLIVIVSAVYAWQGVAMHKQVSVDEDTFHQLQDDYYSQTKATRDGAEANSELSAQLVEIQQTPSRLLQLKLVGVGKILTGIFILLFGILIALMIMPMRLGAIINEQKKQE